MPICLRLSAFLLVSKSRTALKSVREPPTRRRRTGPPPYRLTRARGQTGALFPSSPTTACFTLKLSSSQQRQWRKLFPSRIISLSRLLGLNLYICVCTHTRARSVCRKDDFWSSQCRALPPPPTSGRFLPFPRNLFFAVETLCGWRGAICGCINKNDDEPTRADWGLEHFH